MATAPPPTAATISVADALTGDQIMAEDVFSRNVRKLFETLEQIFDARQAAAKKTGPVTSPTFLSYLKYREHFSQKMDPELHQKLFMKLYQDNKIPILNGLDSWLTVIEAPTVLRIAEGKKIKGKNGQTKKKHAVEVNLTNFYMAADDIPGDLRKKLRENMVDSLYRTFYALFISKISIIKVGEETPEQLEQKREREILIKLCKPIMPAKVPVGKGNGIFDMLSGYARKDDIMKAIQTGDTRALVKGVAGTIETIADGIGMPNMKIGDQAVDKIADRASKFMDGLKKEGDNDIVGMTIKSFGDIGMKDLMPEGSSVSGEEKKDVTLNSILGQLTANSPALAAVVGQDVTADQRQAAFNNLLGGLGIPSPIAPTNIATGVTPVANITPVTVTPAKAEGPTPGNGEMK